MTVSVEEIDRWDAGDVREVFHATRSRAEAAFQAANGIAQLPAFGTWGGEASEAAKEAVERTRRTSTRTARKPWRSRRRPAELSTTSSRSSPIWRSCVPMPKAWA